MDEKKGPVADQSWRDPHQPGPPFMAQLREHRGFLLSAFALVLFVGIIVIAARPLFGPTPSGSAAASPSPPGVPLIGLSPGLAYDPIHHQVVLFNYLGQTWLWSGKGWAAAHPRLGPSGRVGAAMTWDPQLREVLLFGGGVGQDGLPRDTWAWNGSSWREMGDSTAAPPGGWAGMAYDSVRKQMVLVVSVGSGSTATAETWIRDGAHWQPRSQHDGVGPVGPLLPTAFDPRSRTLLVAGQRCTTSRCVLETWSWDGSSWHQLRALHEPGPSAQMGLVQDPVSGHLLLLTAADVPQGVPFPTETWSWNGQDWTRLEPVGKPGGDVYAVGASDGSRRTVWAFEDVTSPLGATRVDAAWAWTGTKWVQSVGATR